MPDEPKPWLLMVAASTEAAAVARGLGGHAPAAEWSIGEVSPRLHLTRTGIGKVNAAVAAAKLGDPARYGAVVSIGLGGALPGASGGFACRNGDIVVATESVYADEGIQTPERFIQTGEIGFPIGGEDGAATGLIAGSAVRGDPVLRMMLEAALGAEIIPGAVATVSTCSGTDALAAAVAERTGAIVEAMEGAAIGHALARLHRGALGFVEVRVVSNTTGDRARQQWDIPLAMKRLGEVAGAIDRALRRS